jgi:flagellin
VDDRKALQSEVTQLRDEIDRIAKGASFNGKKLLDGSFTAAAFQVGAGSGENITVGSLADTRAAGLSKVSYAAATVASFVPNTVITASATAIAAGTLTIDADGAGTAYAAIDLGAIAAASSGQERLGQVVEAINRKTTDTGVSAYLVDNGSGSFAVELLASKTNATTGVALIPVFSAGFTAIDTGFTPPTLVAANAAKGIDTIDVTTDKNVWIAIKKLDSALDQVNSARGTLGAVQSRFENAVGNIQIQAENTSAARGRIMDADFASETSNLSRAQILQQAGTAMVAQANQLPQQVLALLR